ncbi:MAG TPA: alpha/beta hydrolase, partial [Acidimicrobiales bacterium]|nr:alpha/beta hydrolase [Acidimicrobiales bacterium]
LNNSPEMRLATFKWAFSRFFVLIVVLAVGLTSCSNYSQEVSENGAEELSDQSSHLQDGEGNVGMGSAVAGTHLEDSSESSDELIWMKNMRFLDESGTSLTRELRGTGIQQVVIDIGEMTFNALLAGPEDGTPIMLLHGFPSTNYQYRSQIIALADAGFLVFAPNQRGYSPLARPIGIENYSADLLVEDIDLIASALNWSRFHLVGHDWGALIAWAYGGTHPEKLITLTPISVPHPEAFAIALADPSGIQAEMSSYIDFFKELESENAFLANDGELLRSIYESANLSQNEIEPYFEVLGNPEALGAALNWYRAKDFYPEINQDTGRRTDTPDINVPTMYVWSTEDTALGKQGAELTAEYVSGEYRFEVFEGINHWVTEVASTELNAALIDFLSTHPSEHGS